MSPLTAIVILVSIISLLCIFLYYIFFFYLGQRFKKKMLTGIPPAVLREKAKLKLKKYKIMPTDIREAVKQITNFKGYYSGSENSLHMKSTMAFYPRLRANNIFNVKKCLFAFRTELWVSDIKMDYVKATTYSIVKLINNNYLDIVMTNGIATLSLNKKIFAYLDFNNKEIFTGEKEKVGRFERKEFSILNIESLRLSEEYPVYIGYKKLATIMVKTSTLEKIKELVISAARRRMPQIPMFKEPEITYEWEALVLLAIAVLEQSWLQIRTRRDKGSYI